MATFVLVARSPGSLCLYRCRHLLLVPEGDWPNDERFLGQGAFLAFTHLYERDFPADVLAGNAWDASALVRWRSGLERFRRAHLGINRVPMEHTDLDCSLGHGPGANHVHH